MVRDDDGGDAFVNGAARVVSCKQAFHDDWPGPDFSYPIQIVPRYGGVSEGGGDIHQLHGAFTGNSDVFELGNSAVREKRGEPARVRQKLREKRELSEKRAAEELLHAVARIAFAHSGDGRVHSDDQRGEAGAAGAVDAAFGGGAATQEIELIPRGAFGGSFHVFQFVAGNGGENVDGAGIPRGFSGGNFSAGMHQAAVADGGEQPGEGEIEAEDADAKVALVEGDSVARPKEDVVEGAGIFAQRGFVVSAAVEVIEDGARQTALGEAAKIFDVHDAGRAEGGGFGSHGEYFMEKQPREAMRKCRTAGR